MIYILSGLINNNIIYCFEHSENDLKKWASKGIIKCPSCDKPYEYCHGKIVMPYFRHKDKVECNYLYSESETDEHYTGKIDLYKWLKSQNDVSNVVLEGWIPETKQRPDIMFDYKGQKCVFEYQCTPIASEYFERHELYKAAGIRDIWICGTNNYFQFYYIGKGNKRVSTLEKNTNIFYDSKNKLIFKIFRDISNRDYFRIIKGYTYVHLMVNPYDYVSGLENFYEIKSNIFPSDYSKNDNYSLAKCYKLDELKIKGIE